MNYIKAEVYSRQTLLARSTELSLQDDTLILKQLETQSLTVHNPVEITLFTNKGIQQFDATTTFIVDDVQANFIIKNRTDVIERREYLKVNTDFLAKLSQITPPNEDTQYFEEPIDITIVNISLGGMMFNAKEKFELGSTSNFTFTHGGSPVQLAFEIVRVVEEDDETYSYGCKFPSLSLNEDTILCNYIFQIQLLERKKAKEIDQ